MFYERRFINFEQKSTAMNTRLLIKVGLIIPALGFVLFVLMIVVGCFGCFIHLTENFYCGTYCTIGKIAIVASIILFFFLILPDIKSLFISRENASSNKK